MAKSSIEAAATHKRRSYIKDTAYRREFLQTKAPVFRAMFESHFQRPWSGSEDDLRRILAEEENGRTNWWRVLALMVDHEYRAAEYKIAYAQLVEEIPAENAIQLSAIEKLLSLTSQASEAEIRILCRAAHSIALNGGKK